MSTATVVITDPTGERPENGNLPTFHWGAAPEGLATRRQLSAMGLRKNGQDPVARMRHGRLVAYLYDTRKAAAKRPFTPAKRAAVLKAARSRRRCDTCRRTDLTYIPRDGVCEDCR